MSDTISTLNELLADPMVQLVIKRSNARPEEVRMLMLQAGDRAASDPALPPAHVIAAAQKAGWCCA
ncbi:MAG: hypothetical protein Q8Q62_15620 [Mesorhizobium sp.]|nr:hypothetical protein [Mesorhizobium sp.]